MPNVFINKPHHKQELNMSCLPACAKMLLDLIGDTIEEATLRTLLETDENGTPALNVLTLNASLSNVKAEIYEWSLIDLEEYLQTKRQPCIVGVKTNSLPHWDGKSGRHAIIVNGFDERQLFINDPFFDEEQFRIPVDAFLTAWSALGKLAITIERR